MYALVNDPLFARYPFYIFINQVALTHGPENVRPQVKQTDDNGNFCFEVCW